MLIYQLPSIDNPKLFEDMICDLFNELHDTHNFKKFGRNGHKQKGVDIFSNEKLKVVQCKLKDLSRKPILIKRALYSDIDETIHLVLDNDLKLVYNELLIVSNASEDPDFDEYCSSLKNEKNLQFDVTFWGWSTIESKLANCPKTLKKYYPNFLLSSFASEERVLNLGNKKKLIEKDFASWLNYPAEKRPLNSRMIIRSIEDVNYPEHVLNEYGEYEYFKAEINLLTHLGLEFIIGIERVYVDMRNMKWTTIKPDSLRYYTPVKTKVIGVVDLLDIVTYDLSGNDIDNCPILYIKFGNKGTPFKKKYHVNLDEPNMPQFFEEKDKN